MCWFYIALHKLGLREWRVSDDKVPEPKYIRDVITCSLAVCVALGVRALESLNCDSAAAALALMSYLVIMIAWYHDSDVFSYGTNSNWKNATAFGNFGYSLYTTG